MLVGVGVNCDRSHVEEGAGSGDAHRDLAAVGDQYLAEHQLAHPGLRFSRNAFSPSCPSGLTRRAAMVSAVSWAAWSAGMSGTMSISSLARVIPEGPLFSTSLASRATVASSSSP